MGFLTKSNNICRTPMAIPLRRPCTYQSHDGPLRRAENVDSQQRILRIYSELYIIKRKEIFNSFTLANNTYLSGEKCDREARFIHIQYIFM